MQQREDGCKIGHSHLNEKLSFELDATVGLRALDIQLRKMLEMQYWAHTQWPISGSIVVIGVGGDDLPAGLTGGHPPGGRQHNLHVSDPGPVVGQRVQLARGLVDQILEQIGLQYNCSS